MNNRMQETRGRAIHLFLLSLSSKIHFLKKNFKYAFCQYVLHIRKLDVLGAHRVLNWLRASLLGASVMHLLLSEVK